MSSKPFEAIIDSDLTTITGGMRWEQFRQSTNVEDRRSPKAIARDQQWWNQNMQPAQPPIAPGVPPTR